MHSPQCSSEIFWYAGLAQSICIQHEHQWKKSWSKEQNGQNHWKKNSSESSSIIKRNQTMYIVWMIWLYFSYISCKKTCVTVPIDQSERKTNNNVRFVFNPRMHLWWNLGVQEPGNSKFPGNLILQVMTKMPPKVILDVCWGYLRTLSILTSQTWLFWGPKPCYTGSNPSIQGCSDP